MTLELKFLEHHKTQYLDLHRELLAMENGLCCEWIIRSNRKRHCKTEKRSCSLKYTCCWVAMSNGRSQRRRIVLSRTPPFSPLPARVQTPTTPLRMADQAAALPCRGVCGLAAAGRLRLHRRELLARSRAAATAVAPRPRIPAAQRPRIPAAPPPLLAAALLLPPRALPLPARSREATATPPRAAGTPSRGRKLNSIIHIIYV